MSEPEILTIEEVAQYLRVSEKTVYDWAQKGEIPCGKIGSSWRFRRAEIERWVNRKLKSASKHSDAPHVALEQALAPERVCLLESTRKSEALLTLIDRLAQAPGIRDRGELSKAIFQREEIMSTGIGLGVGVPHVRLPSVSQLVMAAGVSRPGLADYESLDGQPVHLVFMIAAGHDQHGGYLTLLSEISRRFKDESLRQRLIESEDEMSFYKMLVES